MNLPGTERRLRARRRRAVARALMEFAIMGLLGASLGYIAFATLERDLEITAWSQP